MNWKDLTEKLKNQGKEIETALVTIRQEILDVNKGRRGDIIRELRQKKIHDITKEEESA